ncbi:hypothetical protein [Mesomycoplasma ovipneumoniae]|nr:hypothetical protein [Mesomycoplasma ovipneumoniae]MDO6829802.1 hypothetical protein [Mesomycoplasma ovipneumoniae]
METINNSNSKGVEFDPFRKKAGIRISVGNLSLVVPFLEALAALTK